MLEQHTRTLINERGRYDRDDRDVRRFAFDLGEEQRKENYRRPKQSVRRQTRRVAQYDGGGLFAARDQQDDVEDAERRGEKVGDRERRRHRPRVRVEKITPFECQRRPRGRGDGVRRDQLKKRLRKAGEKRVVQKDVLVAAARIEKQGRQRRKNGEDGRARL